MTTAVLHAPLFAPWPGHFDRLNQADVVVLVDTDQWTEGSNENMARNVIVDLVGRLVTLRVPVRKPNGLQSSIGEVLLDWSQARWQEKLWRSVQNCYRNHPFWMRYAEELELRLLSREERVADYTGALLLSMCDWLGVTRPWFVWSSELGVPDRGQTEEIVDLAKAVDCDTVLLGRYMEQYVDRQVCADAGVKLQVHGWTQGAYRQYRQERFVPGLSALDLLMNLGPDSKRFLKGRT